MAAAVAALSSPLLWNALTLCSSMLPSLPTALAAAALWNLQQAYAQAPTAGFKAAEISLYTFEEVITIVKKLEALGLEAYTEDDLAGAESCFESALQLLEKTSSPSRLPRKVKLLTNLGITYRMQKLYPESLRAVLDAISTLAQIAGTTTTEGFIVLYYEAGLSALETNQIEEAYTYFMKCHTVLYDLKQQGAALTHAEKLDYPLIEEFTSRVKKQGVGYLAQERKKRPPSASDSQFSEL